MSDKLDDVTEAVTKGGIEWSWMAWVLPVLALLIAAWLVFRAIPDSAGTVVVTVANGDGIQASSTQLKYRGVPIGIVSDVVLSSDNSQVELSIDLNVGREDFAREGAKYWVVRPELNSTSLEGLGTIVSGVEIQSEPGDGAEVSRFSMLARTPLEGVSESDLKITLTASRKSGLNRGSSVSYRGIKTGVVTSINLSEAADGVVIDVNIFEEFADLVRVDSVFWNSGGLDVDFGLFSGADVNVGSVSSLFAGEISFATPDEFDIPATTGDVFVLADEVDDDWLEWQPEF